MGPGEQARVESYASRARAGGQPAVTDKVTKIRVFFPPNWDRNGAQALPQSNMVVLVDTEAGITGVGQGGSPDTVRNVVAERHRQERVRHRDDLAGRVHGRALFAGR